MVVLAPSQGYFLTLLSVATSPRAGYACFQGFITTPMVVATFLGETSGWLTRLSVRLWLNEPNMTVRYKNDPFGAGQIRVAQKFVGRGGGFFEAEIDFIGDLPVNLLMHHPFITFDYTFLFVRATIGPIRLEKSRTNLGVVLWRTFAPDWG